MTAKIEKSTSTRTIVDTSGLRLRDCNRRWMPLDLADCLGDCECFAGAD